ncbi:Polyprenol reductase 1 [Seminavis robusta]|uniref:Polyprenol reductase 1 n=1 Tax=Seminavis robusta TaxID=568900 RepID=A0A9N8DLN4_9STRA|nr:Polyprenol reductase 1 [Seminavis robusta]|eukprot:Sro194_g082850.1 Polyprenol reductase 1 (360) ;mRNA; r:47107-48186
MIEVLLCILGFLVSPAYLCLMVVALLSTLVPFLKDLASHGKTLTKLSSHASTTANDERSPHAAGNSSGDSGESFQNSTWIQQFSQGKMFQIHKRCFLHFYVAGLLSLAWFALSTAATHKTSSCHNQGMLLLALHLARRCYECLRIHQYSENSFMHLAGYVCGVFHYLFLPWMVFDDKITCNDNHLDDDEPNKMALSEYVWNISIVLLCLWGQWEQYQHHALLSLLRQKQLSNNKHEEEEIVGSQPKAVHKIPRGRLFQYISCPHYLAEIVIYTAFYLLLRQQHDSCQEPCLSGLLPSMIAAREEVMSVLLTMRQWRRLVLVLWVSSNLTVTGIRCHNWYLQAFPTYPSLHRKAIFPFIL